MTVIGEAGVGKTRLLAEIAAEAATRGGRVLVGRCYEAEQILPFAPWVDALRAGRAYEEAEVLESLHPRWRSELARLLPELALPGGGSGHGPVDYRPLFESVAQLVQHLGLRQPVMLILEDLHWVDEMSLRLLSFVGRRLQTSPILIVATAREEDLAGAPILRRTLDDLARNCRVVDLQLAPLSQQQTLTLVRTLARTDSEEAAMTGLGEQIWITSEDNPFAVIEIVRALPKGAAAETSVKLAVPKRVRDAVIRHLDRLSERSRHLMTVAAVIGRRFEFPLLRRSAGLEEVEAAELLEELVRCRVLQHVEERFDFTHDRIREVVYSSLLREHQRALHARIADSMEALYADRLSEHVERLAHHAARGELGKKAVAYLRQAGMKAFANSAHSDALTYFTQGLALLGQLAPGAERDREELSLRLALGPALQATKGNAAPEVEHNYLRARELANQVSEPIQQFQALWGVWLVASHRASARRRSSLDEAFSRWPSVSTTLRFCSKRTTRTGPCCCGWGMSMRPAATWTRGLRSTTRRSTRATHSSTAATTQVCARASVRAGLPGSSATRHAPSRRASPRSNSRGNSPIPRASCSPCSGHAFSRLPARHRRRRRTRSRHRSCNRA